MTRLMLAALLLITMANTSFTKKDDDPDKVYKHSATVIRDCSGTYLRMGKDDYMVCNFEMLDGRADNSKVKVFYRTQMDCPPREGMVCMLFHEHKGAIEVTKVK